MEAKKKITSLAQLTAHVQEVELVNSLTGEVLVAEIRDLLPDQVAEIDARVHFPKPPVSDFKKEHGVVTPIYNEDDPKYKNALELANFEYIYNWLAYAWVAEIDGATVDEKIVTLKQVLPMWAFRELRARIEEANGYKLSEVAYAKKKSLMSPIDT